MSSTGTASGDLLAGHLIAALRERRPQLRFSGIGGTGVITADHVFQRDGSFSVVLTLWDDDGDTVTKTIPVVVNNLAPKITKASASDWWGEGSSQAQGPSQTQSCSRDWAGKPAAMFFKSIFARSELPTSAK